MILNKNTKIILLSKEHKGKGGIEKNIDSLYLYLKTNNYNIKIVKIKSSKIEILKTIFFLKKEKPDIIISYESLSNFLAMTFFPLTKQISGIHIPSNKITRKIDLINLFLFKIIPNKIVLPNSKDPILTSNKKCITIRNPIEKKDLDLPKENIILAAGKLTQQKGYDLILSKIDELNLIGWRFIILGEGPEEKTLKALSKGKVEFHGFQNPHEYYAKSKIFILPSRYEGYGNVLAEAMQYGCVPISFDCNYGPAEIITHNINGILVEALNVDKFIKELNILIEDIQKLEYLENNCYEKKYQTIKQHGEDFISLIKTI